MAKSTVSTKTAAKVTKAPAAKKTKVTLVSKATEKLVSIYANLKEGQSPRQLCLTAFEKLGMVEPTQRQTYYNNIITALREAEQEEALKLLEANKPVWSAFKVDGNNIVTSVGLFTSATSAKTFNETYQHHGVVKGLVEKGQVVDAKHVTKPVKVSKAKVTESKAKPAPKVAPKATSAKKKAA